MLRASRVRASGSYINVQDSMVVVIETRDGAVQGAKAGAAERWSAGRRTKASTSQLLSFWVSASVFGSLSKKNNKMVKNLLVLFYS